MYKRSILACLVVLLVGGILSFGASPEWTITVATFSDPPRLDGNAVGTYESGIVTYSVYEPLLKYDLVDFSVKPCLAVDWEISGDGKSAIFYLRKDVRFHDGTDFNAEAVKFNYERTMALGVSPSVLLEAIKEVEVIADYTIKFTTEEPFAFWEDNLASLKGLVMESPSYVKAHATDDDPWAKDWMHEHTCGTGPYMVKEWRHDEYVEMVKFVDYWGGWTGKEPDRVFVRVVMEPGKRKLMLEKGNIDIAYAIPTDMFPALEENPDITVIGVGGMAQQFIPMKCHKGPFANRLLRKAVTYAIDYEAATKVQAYAVHAQGPIPRAMYCHDDTLLIYHQDVEKAKLLMKAAGYSPGEVEVTLTYIAGLEFHRKLAVLVQENLADIGIKVNLQMMTWAVFASLATDPDKSTDMYVFYSAARTADPYIILWETFSPGGLGPGGWNNGYNNPEVGELIDLVEVTPDREVRAEIYKEVQRIITEDAPALFLFEKPYYFVYRAYLKGIIADRMFNSYYYYEMWRE